MADKNLHNKTFCRHYQEVALKTKLSDNCSVHALSNGSSGLHSTTAAIWICGCCYITALPLHIKMTNCSTSSHLIPSPLIVLRISSSYVTATEANSASYPQRDGKWIVCLVRSMGWTNWLVDWLIELRFYVPPDAKTGHFGDVLPSHSLGLLLKKTKSNATKANMHPQQNIPQHNININRKLSYCRGTARRSMSVSSCYVSRGINQSIKVFLEWPKWHCHCKVHCRCKCKCQ